MSWRPDGRPRPGLVAHDRWPSVGPGGGHDARASVALCRLLFLSAAGDVGTGVGFRTIAVTHEPGGIVTFSGNLDDTGVLAFARELERFRNHLEWAAGSGCRCNGSRYLGDIAGAFLVLLEALENGAAPVEAIQTAMSEHKTMKIDHERVEAARRAHAQAEEELAASIECPRCAAAPGTRCSHVTRLRAARAQQQALQLS